jgi:hypothetical protein
VDQGRRAIGAAVAYHQDFPGKALLRQVLVQALQCRTEPAYLVVRGNDDRQVDGLFSLRGANDVCLQSMRIAPIIWEARPYSLVVSPVGRSSEPTLGAMANGLLELE